MAALAWIPRTRHQETARPQGVAVFSRSEKLLIFTVPSGNRAMMSSSPPIPAEFFRHDAMMRRHGATVIGPALARGTHFFDDRLPRYRGGLGDGRGRLAPAERVRRAPAVKPAA